MTESTPAYPSEQPLTASLVPPATHAPMVPAGNEYAHVAPTHSGAPIGKIRGTGTCILLSIVTLGIYTWVWFFQTHSEMKRHSGQGIDGGIALLLAIVFGIVMPYITASEVGGLYERRGQRKPVSGATGLWYFPGSFLLVGPLVWFVKTNGALNAYWRSQGAV